MKDHQVRKLWLLGMAVCFALAHTQSPDVWSNQNQYYLHGAAAAGFGDLRNDWLATTADPTPVFSWLVELAYRGPGPVALLVLYFGMLMLYFVTLHPLMLALFRESQWHYIAMAIFLVCHSAILRVVSVTLFGNDYPWYLQSGVAAQYLLGPGLQPSVFGVLLLVGVADFVSGRPYRAAIWTAIAAVFHPTYLLPAALFILAYQVELLAQRRWRTVAWSGIIALAVVTPSLVYVAQSFIDTNAEAKQILTDIRLPHHCRIERWLDWMAISQIVVMGVGCFLTRGTVLFRPLVFVYSASILLSLVQWWTQSRLLALLFPWRVSAVLMPVAVAVILDQIGRAGSASDLGSLSASARPSRSLALPALLICIAAAMAGIWISFAGVGYYVNHEEDGVIAFVAKSRQPGDVYMLPVKIPDLMAGPRGSVSMTFATPKAGQGIPPDFQRFRLATGAPIYVDFKSIPYADNEVVEWYRRVRLSASIYDAQSWNENPEQLILEGITHLVVPATASVHGDLLQQIYVDEKYHLYRIVRDE